MWPPESLLEGSAGLQDLFAKSIKLKPHLTVIVGNGITRASATEARLNDQTSKQQNSWNAAVQRTYRELYDVPGTANDLVLAEAISRKPEGRDRLIDNVGAAFRTLRPSILHRALRQLRPACWITSNYDTLIERELDTANVAWGAMVGLNESAVACPEVPVFKIHGSFPPDQTLRLHPWAGEPCGPDSIVISEADYDRRLFELMRHADILARPASEAPADGWIERFWHALLNNTVVVVGKGLFWEDLSFNFILKVRDRRLRAKGEKPEKTAFWLEPSLSLTSQLLMRNMGLTPAVPRLPKKPRDEHFYYAGFVGLRELVSGAAEVGLPDDPLELVRRRLDARRPLLVAAGLSAYNVAGVLRDDDPSLRRQLPLPGRRNVPFIENNVEKYAGGAALTAAAVFSALAKSLLPCAILSNVGDDHYAKVIEDFCDQWGIDRDGLERHAAIHTWVSTILVHDAPSLNFSELGALVTTRLDPEGRGQRWFLDRPGGDRAWSATQLAQLRLALEKATVLYLDKWFSERDGQGGFTPRVEAMSIVRESVASRSDLDVLYETGGAGTHDGILESQLGTVVNIVTAGFMFFYRHIVGGAGNPSVRPHTFREELVRVDEVLAKCLSTGHHGDAGPWQEIPSTWQENADRFVRASARRRWLVATLHSKGALALDLARRKMCYVRLEKRYDVVNTTGAGDSFRGAFCYALVKLKDLDIASTLPEGTDLVLCTRFSAGMASQRCGKATMGEALQIFSETGDDAWQDLLADAQRRSVTQGETGEGTPRST